MSLIGQNRFQLDLESLKRMGRVILLAGIGGLATGGLLVMPEVQTFLIGIIENNPNVSPILIPMLTGAVYAVFDTARRFLTNYAPKK